MTEARPLTLSEIITDAVVFWERGRVIYNLALLAGSVAMLGMPWVEGAHYSLPGLILLAVVANVLYTSGYVPDLLAQHTPWRSLWRHLRWGLWLFGTGMALWLALIITFAIGADFGAEPV